MTLVSFDALVEGLRSGRIASFPTDTVPALAVRPEGSADLFALKQRQATKPLILMGSRAEDLWPYVAGTDAERQQWDAWVRQHWPGALTLVLPAGPKLPPQMNPTDPTTIGVRVPDCDIARRVLAATGPLATTSANRSGEPPLTEAADIDAAFEEVLVLSPKAYAPLSASGLPSTVVKWTGENWQVLRQGSVQLSP
ncbi:L-threonylcarbamoyladenylate synthase [Baaleninema sp.]|uniref:L-threonylcarbamoyladenylate synthase n=1 Tax=Baaleninema sp. TaxID=3101197 RepID=UPI003D032E01